MVDKKNNKAAHTLLTVCANAKPEESILFVTDDASEQIADLMWENADEFSKKCKIKMNTRCMHGDEPPKLIAAAMAEADVVFGTTKFSTYHTEARRNAVKNGARFVNMADYNMDMFEKGGLFADFVKQGELMDKVSDVIEGSTINIKTKAGTDLTTSIEGRKAVRQYGRSTEPGVSSSPPDIETAVGPIIGTANGVVVIDGCVPHPLIGVLDEAIKLTIKNGQIVEFAGGEKAKILEIVMKELEDEWVYHLAEIGIGFNNESTLCNSMLEDEGVFGTAHLGFGSSVTFGGTIASNNHLDMVFWHPTITVDGRLIYEDGKPIL